MSDEKRSYKKLEFYGNVFVLHKRKKINNNAFTCF